MTRRLWPRILALVILLVVSNPYVAKLSFHYLESTYPYRTVAAMEPADTVIVLGGILQELVDHRGEVIYEFRDSVDRFEAGIEFMKLGKAKKIILTRGQLPWTIGKPEGEVLAKLAEDRGIDPAKILLTERVENTADEARAVKKLLGPGENPVLITSAFHMLRATLIFENQGINVISYPVDYRGDYTRFGIQDLFPAATAISGNSLVVRELLGRAFYRLKFALSGS